MESSVAGHRHPTIRVGGGSSAPRVWIMVLDVRFIATDDRPAFRSRIAEAFGDDADDDEQLLARYEATFRTDLMIGSFDGDRIVGTFGSFDFDLAVPGGSVPVAGTTVVSVAATHRRQGLLTRMMRMHLDQARARRQPAAVLWASEYPIYGRFGYGPASNMIEVQFDVRHGRVADGAPEVTLELVEADAFARLGPGLFDREFARRPGMHSRSEAWWKWRVLLDPKEQRDGASGQRRLVAYEDGVATGYLLYRQKLEWGFSGANGQVKVIEMVAASDRTRRALWHYVCGIDLFPIVQWWNMPGDDPLPYLLDNPRYLTWKIGDAIWLRPLDVTRMLRSRRYQGSGRVRIGVQDPLYDDQTGVYEITVVDEVAEVRRTDDEPDVSLGVDALGSLLLGHHRATSLRAAGRLTGTSPGIDELDRLFGWPVTPWTQEIF